MENSLKLFSPQLTATGGTSAVKYVRLPTEIIFKVKNRADREKRSFNSVLVESIVAGFEKLEKGDQT